MTDSIELRPEYVKRAATLLYPDEKADVIVSAFNKGTAGQQSLIERVARELQSDARELARVREETVEECVQICSKEFEALSGVTYQMGLSSKEYRCILELIPKLRSLLTPNTDRDQ